MKKTMLKLMSCCVLSLMGFLFLAPNFSAWRETDEEANHGAHDNEEYNTPRGYMYLQMVEERMNEQHFDRDTAVVFVSLILELMGQSDLIVPDAQLTHYLYARGVRHLSIDEAVEYSNREMNSGR